MLPFLTIVAIVTAGWFWFVQPRFGAYLRARTDAAALEERVRTLQEASGRARPQPPADLARTEREFEARVAADDKVADVAAALARAVLASAPAGQLRSFVIERLPRRRRLAGNGIAGADPRLALFPYAVSYTPVRVSFASTFEAAGNVLWQLRDLPTVVEVRSATLTRGLPLMTIDLVVRVLQRGGTTGRREPRDAGRDGSGRCEPDRAAARSVRRGRGSAAMTIRRTHLTLALAALAAAVLYNVWHFVLRPAAPAASRPAVDQPLVGPAGRGPGRRAARDPLTIPAPPASIWRRRRCGGATRSCSATKPATSRARPFRRRRRSGRRSARFSIRPPAASRSSTAGSSASVTRSASYTVAEIEKGAVVFTTPSGERLRVPVHATAPEEVAR